MDEPVLLARAGDVHAGGQLKIPQRLEEIQLAQNVAAQGIAGHEPGRRHVALGGQVEDAIRAHLGEDAPDRRGLPHVAFNEPHPIAKVLDVVHPAPPAVDAEDLDVAAADQVVSQMASDEARESGDQDRHQVSPSKKPRTPAITASISSVRSSGKHGSEITSRAAAHAAGKAAAL